MITPGFCGIRFAACGVRGGPYSARMIKAYEELVDFIAAGSTPAGLLQFQPSPGTKARVQELIRKEKDAGLLPEETSELDDYLKLEHLMRLAKARARGLVERE